MPRSVRPCVLRQRNKHSSIDSVRRFDVSSYTLLSESERLRKILRKSDVVNSVQGNKYPRYKIFVRRQAWKITLPIRGPARTTHAMRTFFAEKETCPVCRRIFTRDGIIAGPPRASRWHILKNADAEVFLAELCLAHSTNWRFFLLAPSLSRPFAQRPFLVASTVPLGMRRKALLMRSLIRSIGECFADRSDVYPSRSATTRRASSPQHTAKRI